MSAALDKTFLTADRWRDEALEVRAILLDCGLTEEKKWNKPCYSMDDENICIIQRMTHFLALMFFKGQLVDDPGGLLKAQGPNSRSAKRLEFNSVDAVKAAADAIRALVASAIEVERKKLKVEGGELPDYPGELVDAFDEDPDFRKAFEDLTPGRQRGYLLHFNQGKQAATRANRIGKYRQHIFNGKGMHDR